MSAEQKTVLGVALAMRHGVIPPHRHDRELLNFFADQLMEARKREAEVGGNTAKLREAVEAVLLAFNYGESMIVNQLPFIKLLPMLRKCVEALAAPPRECDVGTAKEQAERFKHFCAQNYSACDVDMECCRCPIEREKADCELAWAQLPHKKSEAAQ